MSHPHHNRGFSSAYTDWKALEQSLSNGDKATTDPQGCSRQNGTQPATSPRRHNTIQPVFGPPTQAHSGIYATHQQPPLPPPSSSRSRLPVQLPSSGYPAHILSSPSDSPTIPASSNLTVSHSANSVQQWLSTLPISTASAQAYRSTHTTPQHTPRVVGHSRLPGHPSPLGQPAHALTSTSGYPAVFPSPPLPDVRPVRLPKSGPTRQTASAASTQTQRRTHVSQEHSPKAVIPPLPSGQLPSSGHSAHALSLTSQYPTISASSSLAGSRTAAPTLGHPAGSGHSAFDRRNDAVAPPLPATFEASTPQATSQAATTSAVFVDPFPPRLGIAIFTGEGTGTMHGDTPVWAMFVSRDADYVKPVTLFTVQRNRWDDLWAMATEHVSLKDRTDLVCVIEVTPGRIQPDIAAMYDIIGTNPRQPEGNMAWSSAHWVCHTVVRNLSTFTNERTTLPQGRHGVERLWDILWDAAIVHYADKSIIKGVLRPPHGRKEPLLILERLEVNGIRLYGFPETSAASAQKLRSARDTLRGLGGVPSQRDGLRFTFSSAISGISL